MAKLAICRYGTNGEGPESQPSKTYTYIVNDNVRSGDNIQVISTSSKGNKENKFATTAKVLTKEDAEKLSQKSNTNVESGVVKESGVKGQELLNKTRSAIAERKGIDLNQTPYDELSTEQKGQLDITKSYSGKELGLSKKGVSKSQYQQDVRGGNLAMYKQANPTATLTPKAQETFDSYSKQFMKGEQ